MKKSELTAIQWIIGTTLFVVFLAIEEVVAHGNRYPFSQEVLLCLSLIGMGLLLFGTVKLGVYWIRQFQKMERVAVVTRREVNGIEHTEGECHAS